MPCSIPSVPCEVTAFPRTEPGPFAPTTKAKCARFHAGRLARVFIQLLHVPSLLSFLANNCSPVVVDSRLERVCCLPKQASCCACFSFRSSETLYWMCDADERPRKSSRHARTCVQTILGAPLCRGTTPRTHRTAYTFGRRSPPQTMALCIR